MYIYPWASFLARGLKCGNRLPNLIIRLCSKLLANFGIFLDIFEFFQFGWFFLFFKKIGFWVLLVLDWEMLCLLYAGFFLTFSMLIKKDYQQLGCLKVQTKMEIKRICRWRGLHLLAGQSSASRRLEGSRRRRGGRDLSSWHPAFESN